MKDEEKPTDEGRTYPAINRQKETPDWNPLWGSFERLSPEFLEGYLTLRGVPFRSGPLPPKVKELILVAVNVATTHMYVPGVRRHIQNALRAGATKEEILEAIQLTTLLGMHAYNVGVPILEEETNCLKEGSQESANQP